MFQKLMEELLEKTRASRTTLRLETPDDFFPVEAEALAPGVRSIKGDTTIDLRNAKTYKFLQRELRILVQNDCAVEEPAPPPELLDLYGVRAQMLGPIVEDGKLVGIISVHYAGGPREWGGGDVAALEETVARVQEELSRQAGA